LFFNFNISFSENIEFNNQFNNYNTILNTYVDDNGQVNYDALRSNKEILNDFLSFIKYNSPINKPDLFKTKNHKKAYWINVYNALAIKIIIDNPNKNILDIYLIDHFVFLKKFIIGGEKYSLYDIENKILRKKYFDPRVHFAINCASNSCPILQNNIYNPDSLDNQLNTNTFKFINNSKNVLIDSENKLIYLNKIFKWYKNDFNKKYININEFIYNFLIDKKKINKSDFLKFKLKYNSYDWKLNKQ